MKNLVQEGKVVTVTAPYALSSGDGCQVGSVFGVASMDALISTDVDVMVEGVFDLTKIGSQAWAQGDDVYWDNANKRCTNVASGNRYIGRAMAAVGSGAGETTGRVLLNEGGSQKLAVIGGQHTSVAASDTVATGLATVVAVVASYDDDAGDANFLVTASIGDQAGTPAAGSILLKSWKTDGTDPTPVAATSFTKKINWIAYGTRA